MDASCECDKDRIPISTVEGIGVAPISAEFDGTVVSVAGTEAVAAPALVRDPTAALTAEALGNSTRNGIDDGRSNHDGSTKKLGGDLDKAAVAAKVGARKNYIAIQMCSNAWATATVLSVVYWTQLHLASSKGTGSTPANSWSFLPDTGEKSSPINSTRNSALPGRETEPIKRRDRVT